MYDSFYLQTKHKSVGPSSLSDLRHLDEKLFCSRAAYHLLLIIASINHNLTKLKKQNKQV